MVVRRRTALSRDEVVAAASIVADRGIDKVTMAAVAGELGVTSMALYQYVDDKQHLMTLVLDSLLAGIEVPDPSTGPWDERLRQLHLAVTGAMTRYPGLASAVGETVGEVPRLLDGYLQILLSAGFDERATALAYSGLYYLAMGVQHPYRGDLATPAARPPDDPAAHVATARVAAAISSATVEECQDFAFEIYLEGLRRWRQSLVG